MLAIPAPSTEITAVGSWTLGVILLMLLATVCGALAIYWWLADHWNAPSDLVKVALAGAGLLLSLWAGYRVSLHTDVSSGTRTVLLIGVGIGIVLAVVAYLVGDAGAALAWSVVGSAVLTIVIAGAFARLHNALDDIPMTMTAAIGLGVLGAVALFAYANSDN